jgi:hypothetical protein
LVSSVEHCNFCHLRFTPWYFQLNIVMSVLYGFTPWYLQLNIVISVLYGFTPWYLQLNIVMSVLYGFRLPLGIFS